MERMFYVGNCNEGNWNRIKKWFLQGDGRCTKLMVNNLYLGESMSSANNYDPQSISKDSSTSFTEDMAWLTRDGSSR